MALGKNVKRRRKQLRLTQNELAEAINVTQSAISALEDRDSRSSRNIIQLATALKISPDKLIGEDFDEADNDKISVLDTATYNSGKTGRKKPRYWNVSVWDDDDPLEDDEIEVPTYDIKGSAGSGTPVYTEKPNGFIRFKKIWLEHKGLLNADLAAIEVDGNSMEPYLCHNDSALIKKDSKKFLDGKVFAFRIYDDIRIKRIFTTATGNIRLASDNLDKTRFPDEVLSEEIANELHIIGMIVWRGG